MPPNGRPGDARVLALTERHLSEMLPPGWSVRSHDPAKPSPKRELTVETPDGETLRFAVGVARNGQIPRLNRLLEQLAASGSPPMVVAAFLSTTVRDLLVDRCISHVDATGNIWVVGARPGLFVVGHGSPRDPWPTDDTLRSLRGRAAGRAVRALVDFCPPYGVRDIAVRASVPLGSLSRTLDLLDREGLVSRGPQGSVRELDWERAVRRWAQDYGLARSNRIGYFHHPQGPDIMNARLAKPIRPYALSGIVGAERLRGLPATGPSVLFIEDLDLGSERMALEPSVPEAADVVLAEGYDPVVFDRTVVLDGLHVAAPAQLAADLLTLPDGDRTGAEGLLSWMRANESTWRL